MKQIKTVTLTTILCLFFVSSETITQDFWKQINGPYHPHATFVGITNNGTLFVGSPFGLFRSTDQGVNWFRVDSTFRIPYLFSFASTPNGAIFLGTSGGAYCSFDNGDSWTLSYYGINNPVWSITVKKDGNILLGTEAGAYISSNNGDNWILASSDTIAFVSFAIDSMNNIYAGTSIGILFSTNNGADWILVDTLYAEALLYITKDILLAASDDLGVFRTTDGGNTWNCVGLTNASFFGNNLVYTPKGDIIAGTWGQGVYRTTNNGDTWETINEGITDTLINSLTVSSDGFVFVGTPRGGLLRSIEPLTNIQEGKNLVPTIFVLEQNYPNPFNPSTTISYQLLNQSHVSLKIFDLLGREIATLVNGIEAPGYKSVTFDASSLSSGVYYYRLQSDRYNETKKLLLLR